MIDPITGVSLGLGGLQTVYGLIKGIQASRKDVPEAKPVAQLDAAYRHAVDLSKFGYSPEEENAFKQQLAMNNAQQYRMAMQQAGRTLSGAVLAGINYGNTNALNQYAANDKRMQLEKQRYADSFANQYQRISDTNTAIEGNIYNQEQNAAGSLIHAGINNAIWAMVTGGKGASTTNSEDAVSGAEALAKAGVTGAVGSAKDITYDYQTDWAKMREGINGFYPTTTQQEGIYK